MPDDTLTAALDEIRERHALTAEPCGNVLVVIGRFKHSIDDVPRLLALADAVIGLCRDTDGNWLEPESELPVGEFQAAISRALLGEENSDGA